MIDGIAIIVISIIAGLAVVSPAILVLYGIYRQHQNQKAWLRTYNEFCKALDDGDDNLAESLKKELDQL